ncbi:PP2C family protein-serine/threonine phosphatase [Paracnuella aquatica]|uniref:PP2C family protein-serine/threonine phosphatase n=1 Tax=Paracnuella aquatica TaxID=2268757 RepID=UPI000DF016C8|nr:protein phosphatase 2C domain-containing protein [Paracnuella aquatica]RPD51555.1 serine/threonine-protein phosphatase [Paracnuella aquatica]
MSKHYFGATDVGRMRQNNEDAFFVQPVLGGAYLAGCVIDGVGGYEGGEVAAAIAQQVLPDYLRIPSGDVPTMMLEAMMAANEKIIAEKRQAPALADMACVATLVLVNEAENSLHYIHVGDTRLYLFRDGTLVKVSKDHSFVGFLEDNGRLSEPEALAHPKRNEIDKALGFEPNLKRDYFDFGSSPFLPGDVLLLCSDGLTDLVPAAGIVQVLESGDTLQQQAMTLIESANEQGGKDNITVVLLQHSRQPQKQRALKPKKKAAPKERAPKKPEPAKSAVSVTPAKDQPVKGTVRPKRSGRNTVIALALLSTVLAIALIFVLWRQNGPALKTDELAGTEEGAQLARLFAVNNGDTLDLPAYTLAQPVVLADSLKVAQDTVFINGNGMHLKASEQFKGVAISLLPGNKLTILQDVVLEGFTVGLQIGQQTVRLKNVQFLNCAVPVKHGASVPVNSPHNLTIKDSVFFTTDTLSR